MTYGSILVPIDEHPAAAGSIEARSPGGRPRRPPGRPRDHPAARGSPEVAAETERRGDHEEGVRARQAEARAGIRRFEAQAKKAGVASSRDSRSRPRPRRSCRFARAPRTSSCSLARRGRHRRPGRARRRGLAPVGRAPGAARARKGTACGFPEKVLVAWNGSREAARALSDSVPLLARAKSVIVFSSGPAATRVRCMARRRPCAISRGTDHRGDAARTVADERVRPHDPRAPKKIGADLLVMAPTAARAFAELVLAARRGPSCAGRVWPS